MCVRQNEINDGPSFIHRPSVRFRGYATVGMWWPTSIDVGQCLLVPCAVFPSSDEKKADVDWRDYLSCVGRFLLNAPDDLLTDGLKPARNETGKNSFLFLSTSKYFLAYLSVNQITCCLVFCR